MALASDKYTCYPPRMSRFTTFIAGVVMGASLTIAPAASAAFAFTETFSTPGSTSGWANVFGSLTLMQTAAGGGALGFTSVGGAGDGDFINANSGASGGAFVGDFTSAGLNQARFTIFIGSGSANYAALDLYDSVSNTEWQYPVTIPASGSSVTVSVPLDASDPGWVFVRGNSLAFVLANTTDFGIALTGSVPVDGYVDNVVVAAPEPGTVFAGVLAVVSAGFAWRRRR